MRDVFVVDEVDGLSCLVARLATEQAHAVMASVRSAAQSDATVDAGSAGERRADALTSLVLGGEGAGGGGAAVHLDVVVGLDQLLGDDSAGAVELRGSGSVSMGLLCALLDDPQTTATLRRLVVDPYSGHLLEVGRRAYEVPQRLREYIALRDRTCRLPGCARRADRCQVDHAVAWDDGGATSPGNLGALCARHHNLKTFAGWQLRDSGADGSCTWISPMGRQYRHAPPRY